MSEDVTVASTTDTEEEVRIAAGHPAEGDEPEEGETPEVLEAKEEPTEGESEPPKPAGEKPQSSPASEADEEEEVEEEEKPKGNKLQKRIDQITREKYDLRDENERLRRQLADATKGISAKEPTNPPADVKPVRANFKSDEEFIDSLVTWRAKQEAVKIVNDQAAQVSREQLAEVWSNYNAGVVAIREEHPDYDEVVGGSQMNVSKSVQNAIIGYEGEGPALAYYLATHPEYVTRLNELSELRAVTEIGRLHGRLFPDEPAESDAPPAPKPVAAAPAPKPKPKVVEPPKPAKRVAGSAPTNATPLDEMSFSDYKRVREEQIRGRNRR